MRTLSLTLLEAQQKESAVPHIKLLVSNKHNGVNRYNWVRFYNGSEDDYYHCLAIPGDGSLIRVRITPPADSSKLYLQRIINPGLESDYTQWIYTGEYSALATAVAALGQEVSVFWIKSNREVRCIRSVNYGATWGNPELIDYSPSSAIYGMAATYKPNGDLAIFFADQSILYVKKCLGGTWQTKTAWDKTTGDLSGVGCVYGIDWNLMVTGKDAGGGYKLWSLVYGDGGDVGTGTWSALKEITSAPAGGDFQYQQPFLNKTDVYRCIFVEKFTGNEAYSRPFQTYSVLETDFVESLWKEPSPLNLSSAYGLAIAHDDAYIWLDSPAGVWQSPMEVQGLDITEDVISLKQEADKAAGNLTVDLRNDDGKYTSLGQGNLTVLDKGCQLEFSPGYLTTEGTEYSEGLAYYIESFEYISEGGKASLTLRGQDGWGALDDWHARHQFRWNKAVDEASVKDIISVVLARVGLKLEVNSQSAAITAFYPDFTINPGENGKSVILKLLSFVPDVIFVEGSRAYLVNPQPADDAVYSYGINHVIKEGRYRQTAMRINSVQVEGLDAGSAMILAERFDWDDVARSDIRLQCIEDRNLNTLAEVQQLGDVYLRQSIIASERGIITVPVNCGQQLYDVITVTDPSAGLSAVKKRVMGVTLLYHPYRGEYFQRLELGGL